MKEVFGIGISTTLEEVCTPSRLALLVYDMQVGIKSQIQQADLIVSKVQRVLNAARAARVRIFFTRHMSLPKELMGAFQYRMTMAWQGVDDLSFRTCRQPAMEPAARLAALDPDHAKYDVERAEYRRDISEHVSASQKIHRPQVWE